MGTKKSTTVELLFNIVIPILILSKFSGEDRLGPTLGLIVALAFPTGYGLWDMRQKNGVNFFSVVGFVSVLLTGVIGLLELPTHWLAVKEASIPFLIGLFILGAMAFGRSPVYEVLKGTLNFEKVNTAAKTKNKKKHVGQAIKRSNIALACVFFLAALANYILATVIVVALPGKPEYNAQLGTLTGLSFVVIVVPFVIAFMGITYYLMRTIAKATGLSFDVMMCE